MRLIDLDQTIFVPIVGESSGGVEYEVEMTIGEMFDKFLGGFQPEIVDAVPVAHGRWEEHEDCNGDYYYTCSACGCDWTTIEGTPEWNGMRYCPECGARMDGERRSEDGSVG